MIEIRAASKAVPISLSTAAAPPFTGTVGTFIFRRNRIVGRRAKTPIALSAIYQASRLQGELIAEENEFSGYPSPFYLRSMRHAKISGNKIAGIARVYLTDGTVGSIDDRDNEDTAS